MALTSTGLTNGGGTGHYQIQYDDSLSAPRNPGGPEPARTNALIAACENDFNLMSGWFGNVALDVNTPIAVNVTQNSGGAGWSLSGGNLTVTLNPGSGPASFVRYLLVAEMVEQFMRAQNQGWFGSGTEGSEGEGLSRFLGAQFLLANGLGFPPSTFANSNNWLSTARADFVNNINPTDDGPDAITGCSLLFIYYLVTQLAFSINALVGAGGSPPAAVYKNLTGSSVDPFPFFKRTLDNAFPGTATITGPNLDNPYPLWAKQFGIAFPGSTRLDSPLVELSRVPQQEEVFWIGANGDVSSNWRNDTVDNGQWHQQFGIAFPNSVRGGSPLIVLSRVPQQEEVFWIGANGDVSSNWRNDNVDNGQWHQQFGIAFPNSVRADSPLVVLSRNPSQEEVFWVGANGDVSSNWRNDTVDNGQWHQQFGIAFPNSVRGGSPLIMLSRVPQQEEVFWIGANGDVSSNWRNDNVDNGQWHQQFGIAFPNSVRGGSPLIVLSRNPSQEEVFWIGANGDVSSNWRNDNVNNGQWHQQFGIAVPGSVREDSPLVAVARTPQREDIFWIGVNGDVSNAWRDDSIDGGQWHTQVGIAVPGSVRAGSPLFAFARTRTTIEVFWLGANGDVSSTFLG